MSDATVTTVILIRHAERVEPNPDLNADGRKRARLLTHVFANAGISTIYVSDATRTKQTAKFLVGEMNIPRVEITEPPAIRTDILTNHAGQTVLVVGHSDTVPRLVEQLGGGVQPDIPATEFDNLFVVSVRNSGNAGVTKLKYGVRT
jgi:broad specificity phosphatase PhoE